MSSSGVDSVNSGPLIIRTYLDASANNTYVLGQYDRSIPPNRVLVTSTGGLLVPSDSIVISSINVSTINAITINSSTINASTINVSTINSSTINASTINVSTINISNMFVSTAYVSTLSTCDIFCPDVLTISSFRQTYLGAEQFEYRSSDPSTIGAFKVELYGSNLLAYKSTIGIDATILQNNGGGQLVLGTNQPIMFLNGLGNGDNNVGIGTSNPQAILHVAEPTSYEEYTSPGLYTYDIPTGAKLMEFEMVAAGGANFIDPGWPTVGGGGGYMKGKVDVSGLSGSIIIKVGSVGVYQSASAVQSGASFLSTSSGVLLTMMGAGGSQGASDNFISYAGGGGGGGTWTPLGPPNQFIANGTAGQDGIGAGSAGQGGGAAGGTGGIDYSGGSGGPGINGITQAGINPNYTESLGGVIPIGVPGGQPDGSAGIGGNGFSGGGSSSWYEGTESPESAGGGGGGSSYYNGNYVTIINSLSGDSYKAAPVIQGYGSNGQNGYVSILFPALEPAIVTNGRVGIGTTEPTALLDVNGSIKSNSVSTINVYDIFGSAGSATQVLTASTSGIVWRNSPLQSGTAQLNSGTVQSPVITSYNLTTNSIIQLTWYNDNLPNCQNPIYEFPSGSGNYFAKQVWWNLTSPATNFQIEIGPDSADVGKYHLIKWALLSL